MTEATDVCVTCSVLCELLTALLGILHLILTRLLKHTHQEYPSFPYEENRSDALRDFPRDTQSWKASFSMAKLYSSMNVHPGAFSCSSQGTLSVQSLSHVRFFATPWTAACQASLSHHQLLEPTQTHVHRVGDAIQPSHPLSSPFPPAFNLSQHQGLFH